MWPYACWYYLFICCLLLPQIIYCDALHYYGWCLLHFLMQDIFFLTWFVIFCITLYICAKLLHASLLVCELNVWYLCFCIWFWFRNVAILRMCKFIPFHTCRFYTVLLVSLLRGFSGLCCMQRGKHLLKPARLMSPAL